MARGERDRESRGDRHSGARSVLRLYALGVDRDGRVDDRKADRREPDEGRQIGEVKRPRGGANRPRAVAHHRRNGGSAAMNDPILSPSAHRGIAAIYARKSTGDSDRTAEARSTARQIDRATEYASARGWTVDPRYIFTDENTSGAEWQSRHD